MGKMYKYALKRMFMQNYELWGVIFIRMWSFIQTI
jgi:hypothetical protein